MVPVQGDLVGLDASTTHHVTAHHVSTCEVSTRFCQRTLACSAQTTWRCLNSTAGITGVNFPGPWSNWQCANAALPLTLTRAAADA
jgi:hypothetical protein